MTTIVLATRNDGKLREIRPLQARLFPEATVLGLDEVGTERDPAEEGIETFDSFEENAIAKARYFQKRLANPDWWILAEDSGLCVDALDGGPGVRSKRFSGVTGPDADAANNARLLEALREVPSHDRTARYRAVAALVSGPGRPVLVSAGECEGVIAEEPRGSGGFGYDPLFVPVPAGRACTMAELPPAQKRQISHRTVALRGLFAELHALDGAGERGQA